jgi:hypothetical protein
MKQQPVRIDAAQSLTGNSREKKPAENR